MWPISLQLYHLRGVATAPSSIGVGCATAAGCAIGLSRTGLDTMARPCPRVSTMRLAIKSAKPASSMALSRVVGSCCSTACWIAGSSPKMWR